MFIAITLCIILLISSVSCCSVSLYEYDALKDFFNSLRGDIWNWKANDIKWNFDTSQPKIDPCAKNWTGVGCNSSCSILNLKLKGYNLTGKIPYTISSLISLSHIEIASNSIDGSIDYFSFIPRLVFLDISNNQFSGTLPDLLILSSTLVSFTASKNKLSGFGNLINQKEYNPPMVLQMLDISYNKFLATIPPNLFKSPSIQVIYIHYNNFNGTLPSMTEMAKNLLKLDISSNSISGSLPNDITVLSNLNYLRTRINAITGTLPENIQAMKSLEYYNGRTNMMNGTIPVGICQLTKLTYLAPKDNFHTGRIPDCVGNLTLLNLFAFDQNRFTGTIPSSIGFMTNLNAYMFVSNNFLVGTIPSTLSKLNKVQNIWFFNNSLTGTIPPALLNLTSVRVFLANMNRLTGNMNDMFRGYVPKNLVILDLSKNMIRGSIPSEPFTPDANISVFAASLNCLEGTLPTEICAAKNLMSLVLHGLSLGCSSESKMTGSIPQCLYSLPNLRALYLSSNSFEGELSDDILISSPLISNLSLSYNKLGGTIPSQTMGCAFNIFDLSHNKFKGVLSNPLPKNNSYSTVIQNTSVPKLILSVNRISGDLPSNTLKLYDSVDILSGNHFSCSVKTLPESDPAKKTFNCGSSDLDFSLYVLVVVSFIFIVYVICEYLLVNFPDLGNQFDRYKIINSARSIFLKIKQWKSSIRTLPPCLINTRLFVLCLSNARRINYVMSFFAIFFSSVLYPSLKSNYNYSTQDYQYNWYVSLAFLRGVGPSVIFFFYWVIFLSTFIAFIYKSHSTVKQSSSHVVDEITVEIKVDRFLRISKILKSWAIMVGSFSIVFVVNTLYVLGQLTLNETYKSILQFSMAVYKHLWNNVFVGLLLSFLSLKEVNRLELIRFRLFLIILNSIIAPLVATLFIDDSCLKYLIFSRVEVTAFYQYPFCQTVFADGTCDVTSIALLQQQLSFTPPFIYSFNCASSLFTNFIPILIYLYAFTALIFPLSLPALSRMSPDRIPKKLLKIFHGALFPFCLDRFRYLIRGDIVIVIQMLHFAVMLTFGLVSPPMAIAGGLVIHSEIYCLEIILGRLICQLNTHNSFDRYNERIENDLAFCWRGLKYCIWLISIVSAIFFGIVFLDMAGDDVGVLSGSMYFIASPCFIILIWMAAKKKVLEKIIPDFFVVSSDDIFDNLKEIDLSNNISSDTLEGNLYSNKDDNKIMEANKNITDLKSYASSDDFLESCKRSDNPIIMTELSYITKKTDLVDTNS